MQARKTSPGRFQVTSQNDESVEYTVILNPSRHSCTCPHFTRRLAQQAAGDCKHIQVALKAEENDTLASKWTRAAERAKKLTNAQLDQWLQIHQAQDSLIVAGAIRYERHARKQAEKLDAELKALFA